MAADTHPADPVEGRVPYSDSVEKRDRNMIHYHLAYSLDSPAKRRYNPSIKRLVESHRGQG
jgi:hypothetical protein